jgi:hypothetical protein
VLAMARIAIISWGRPSGDVAAGGLASSIIFGLLSAFGFGSFFAAMDVASEGDIPWALLVAWLTAVTVFVAAMLLSRLHQAPVEELVERDIFVEYRSEVQ